MTFFTKPGRRKAKSLRFQTLETRQLMTADAAFQWQMEDRFGVDRDSDGRIDMWHDAGFIQEDRFTVEFDASDSKVTGLSASAIPEYTWRIASTETGDVVIGRGKTYPVELPQGEYFVNLTVDARSITGNPNDIDVAAEHIRVKDILILSMGDSFGSGEGNPEVNRNGNQPALWADEWEGSLPSSRPDGAPPDDHPTAGAHRSSKSASAVAALELEQSDPHTSVTYVSVAWTGAAVNRPLDDDGNPVSTEDDPRHYLNDSADGFSQFELADELIGNRKIDSLALSIGGNDIGFADLVTMLVVRPTVPQNPALPPQPTPVLDLIETSAQCELDKLPATYESLNQLFQDGWIDNGQLNASDVLLMEYADPTWNADHGTSAIVDDIIPGFQVDPLEVQFARDKIINPLKTIMQDAARDHQWTYVGGIANAFKGHGYAAEDPYDPATIPSRERWFRTATESRDLQGPYTNASVWQGIAGAAAYVAGGPLAGLAAGLALGAGAEVYDKIDTMGTLHPNELGHEKMGEFFHTEVSRRLEAEPEQSSAARLERSPYVREMTAVKGGFEIEFDQPVDVNSLRRSLHVEDASGRSIGWSIPNAPAKGFISGASVRLNQATPQGYRVVIHQSVVNGYGWQLDQDRDGIGGEVYQDRFVWEDFTGPHGVAYALPEYAAVRLRFSEPIDIATFSMSNLSVTDARGLAIPWVTAQDVRPVAGSGGQAFDVQLSSFPVGGFRMVVDSNVRDIVGIPLDQNENGLAGEATDHWRITHVDTRPAQINGVGIARESRVLIGGGTALIVVAADEPLLAQDFRGRARLVHSDGRIATLGTVSVLGHQSGTGYTYLLEFTVPDIGDYQLTLDAGIRDWFGNRTPTARSFALKFQLTTQLAERFDGRRPDAMMERPYNMLLSGDPEFMKDFETGPPILSVDWQSGEFMDAQKMDLLDEVWSMFASEKASDGLTLLSELQSEDEPYWWD